ncbi:MAG: P1 family peptidase [Micromonosporaceae bacterium]
MRAREFGLAIPGTTGQWNAITDVPGVEVGYTTLISGESVRTGVTAVVPRGRAAFEVPCAAGWYSLNGNGEMTGTTWLSETGALRLPVLITNTHAVGPCHRGVIDWALRTRPALGSQWLLPVVAETWDGWLNDVNGPHVSAAHAAAAIDAAVSGPLAEGCVGGGTGMNCYQFKGGSGTSSRVVPYGPDSYTVGVFVQANFGSRDELTVRGHQVGPSLAADNPMRDGVRTAPGPGPGSPSLGAPSVTPPPGAGSVIVVIGTDAPLLPGQCTALARRVPLGLARTGTSGSHFSGDVFLAFSTANPGALSIGPAPKPGTYETLRAIPWPHLDRFYTAAVEAVEESVLNALLTATPMTGHAGHHTPALPHNDLRTLLELA